MKIYFAGNITVERERILLRREVDRLFSFYYHGEGKEFEKEFKFRIGNEDIFCRGSGRRSKS